MKEQVTRIEEQAPRGTVYEPPTLDEVGSFATVTRFDNGWGDFDTLGYYHPAGG